MIECIFPGIQTRIMQGLGKILSDYDYDLGL